MVTSGDGRCRSGSGRVGRAVAYASVLVVLALAHPDVVAARSSAEREANARGWSYLVEKLVADGQDRERVSVVFADERFPAFDGLRFSLRPREPRSLYRGFLTSASVARARLCRAQHADALTAAEERYGVSASVVAAILHVETACGRNTGSSRILPALARLAMAAEPANLADNIENHTGNSYPVSAAPAQPTVARAQRLEEMFYPEVRATFEISDRLGIDPLEMRGSGSGAFGMPQFLPTSYVRFGRDGDADGRVSLYDPADAIPSCAAYLEAKGWHHGLSFGEKREVIWHYNHSPAYVDTVLALASRIEAPARPATTTAAAHRTKRSTSKSAAKANASIASAKSKSAAAAAKTKAAAKSAAAAAKKAATRHRSRN